MTAPSRPSASAPDPAPDGRVPNERTLKRPYELGPMPMGRSMVTVDERVVAAPAAAMFDLARLVEDWPAHLAHYRFVRFRARTRDGGGLVEMSANRPFGPANWPTWWLSEMGVDHARQLVRYRHVQGVTAGMDVEWSFESLPAAADDRPQTRTRIVHVWDGPRWPAVGTLAAVGVIGPVFVHGIASRTLAGLARAAESRA
jgi:ribosome-associated toxin RatA of RatAB toxin-antitoxin module